MTGIAERTRADYHRELELHLIPHFGQVDLRDVTQLKPKDVRAWVNQLRTGPRPQSLLPHPQTPAARRNPDGFANPSRPSPSTTCTRCCSPSARPPYARTRTGSVPSPFRPRCPRWSISTRPGPPARRRPLPSWENPQRTSHRD
ncbi:hypothetical protein ACFWTE_05840 [Nocardiopsis sp. NPDC058631]|uniref:hypothetical protein n=1 Tax=Nocardiopsis sp. NPDC058631 TaxID=3346566 RepID=UPI003660A846